MKENHLRLPLLLIQDAPPFVKKSCVDFTTENTGGVTTYEWSIINGPDHSTTELLILILTSHLQRLIQIQIGCSNIYE